MTASGREDFPAGELPLEQAQALDWRFLLPDPALGRTACLGAPRQELLAALSAAVVVDTDNHCPGGYDDVVVTGPDHGRITRGASLLRPGGCMYMEISGRHPVATLRAVRRSADRMRAVGLCEVEAFWHCPDFASSRAIVSLGDLRCAHTALGRSAGKLKGTIQDAVVRALAAAGALRLLVRHASVVGRRPGTSA